MSEEHSSPKVTLKVISQQGFCQSGHFVGQEFDVSGSTPAGMCPAVFQSAFPIIFALQNNAHLSWAEKDGGVRIVCPDYKNPVLVEIKRLD